MHMRWSSTEGGSWFFAQALPAWAKWTSVLIGAPIAVYMLTAGGSGGGSRPDTLHEADFDNFLVAQGEHPTGMAPPADSSSKSGKKSKKGRKGGSKGGGSWLWSLDWGRGVAPAERGQVSGPFETFLKVEEDEECGEEDSSSEDEDHRDPVDFNSFLRSAIPSNSTAQGNNRQTASQVAAQPTGPAGPRADQARVLVMYGTEFGFSKEIAEKLCDRLRAADKYWPVLEDMAEYPTGYDFSREQALFIACSTQGDGVPPTEPRDFCEWLMAGKAGNLAHMHFSVCALGDRSYQHFCRCGKMLDAALETAGAASVAPRQDVNKEDWDAVNAWMDAAVAGLNQRELKPVGAEAAAAFGGASAHTAPKVKKWGKSRPYPARVIAVESLCNVTSKDDKVTVRVEVDVGTASGLGDYQPGDALGLFAPNASDMVELLLQAAHADGSQQVPVPSWHFTEDPDERGEAGSPQGTTMPLREAMLKCYDLRVPKAELFHALWAALPESVRKQQESGTTNVQLNEDADKIAASGDEAVQAALLAKLLAGGSEALESYFDYTGRWVDSVLRTFPSAKLSVTQLLGGLRALQPRLYSISSSPLEGQGRVQATIAEVRYKAYDGSTRAGVCSGHVSSFLQPGDRVRAYIHKNPDFRLPANPATPIIMVGPGTGLAPFRAFILHRLLGNEAGSDTCSSSVSSNGSATAAASSGSSEVGVITNGAADGHGIHANGTANDSTADGESGDAVNGKGHGGVGEMVLFFGCRRRDQDYIYGKDLDGWAESGDITLFNAFSREQSAKVYVQDRLRMNAELVWKLIHEQGAHFYVCGDASSMAGAVEVELLSIFASHLAAGADANNAPTGGKKADKKKKAAAAAATNSAVDSGEAAKAYLESLATAGRYQRDVWYS